jgi:hypothetical protein
MGRRVLDSDNGDSTLPIAYSNAAVLISVVSADVVIAATSDGATAAITTPTGTVLMHPLGVAARVGTTGGGSLSSLAASVFTGASDKDSDSAVDLTDPAQLTRATQLLTAVQGLLRAGEATNHLHAGDFIFKTNEKSVVIHIPPTKTCKTGEGVWVEIADNNSSITAYKLLVRLFAMRDLLKKPSEMVFCMIRQGRLYPEKRSSKDAFGELIKSSVAAIGLDRTLYSGHSCRAGGATDFICCGCPVLRSQTLWSLDIRCSSHLLPL